MVIGNPYKRGNACGSEEIKNGAKITSGGRSPEVPEKGNPPIYGLHPLITVAKKTLKKDRSDCKSSEGMG